MTTPPTTKTLALPDNYLEGTPKLTQRPNTRLKRGEPVLKPLLLAAVGVAQTGGLSEGFKTLLEYAPELS